MQDSPSQASTSSPRAGYARSRETRARILAAAMAEASDVGFHKTSVARIAARADVAVGNLHYHFGSKAGLLRELMVSLVTDLRSQLQVSIPSDSADFFDHERAALLAYLEWLRANPAYARLADEVRLHDPDLYQRALEGWVDQFVLRVRSAIDGGFIRQMSDHEIRANGYFFLGTHQYLDRLMEADPYPGDAAIADAYLGLVRNGLGRSPDPTD